MAQSRRLQIGRAATDWLDRRAGARWRSDPALMRTYRASLSDLGALRMRARHQPARDAARGRPAVVHGAVRPRQPDHELPGAALPAGPGGDHAAGARRRARRTTATTSTNASPARSCTSCASASSTARGSARTRRTSGRPTPRRCSSSCSTSTTAGRATRSSCAGSSRTPARPSTGSPTAAI